MKKAKILMISPNMRGLDDGVNRIQPSLGLMLIASVLLKAGHEVKIWDTSLEGWNNRRLIDPIITKTATIFSLISLFSKEKFIIIIIK